MENDRFYRPSTGSLSKLSKFYGVSYEHLGALAGAQEEVSPELKAQACKFTSKPEPVAKLSSEETKALNQFMRYLKDV